jgi:hypothetical protein
VWLSSRSFHSIRTPISAQNCHFVLSQSNPHPHLHIRYGGIAFIIDRASKALVEPSLLGEPRTYNAISKRSGVPLTTLYYRDHGRRSNEEKAQGQQYLTPLEEKALEKYLKLMADLGNPMRIKCLPSLAFIIAYWRSTTNKATKLLGKNWPRGFQKRHPTLTSRRVRAMA